RAETSCCAAYCEAVFSTGRLRVLSRIQQAVEMHDEIADLGVVDGRLGLRLPRGISRRVVGKYADDVHLIEILEDIVFEVGQLAADNEMKQLLRGGVWHCGSFLGSARHAFPGRAAAPHGSGRLRKCETMLACRSRPAATSTPCATSRRL